ncbi:MAG TPA: hypothetical protein VM143_18470 [Acidimicrobiales bacterium]|nr:hypothetical protein [Acidimicrobiales bacterium]
MAELAALRIGDPPDVWSSIGFVVEDGAVHVSGVRHELGGEKQGGGRSGRNAGIRDWSVRGLDPSVDAIDGLPLGLAVAPARPTPDHPNGVVALDHVVLLTPNLGRTIESFESVGIELRRVRDTGTDAEPRQQAFFKVGGVILEVVGPKAPSGDGPLRFFGLAWTVAEAAHTSAFFGDRLKPFKDAVQPGRQIATLTSSAGSTVPHAFMSAEPS